MQASNPNGVSLQLGSFLRELELYRFDLDSHVIVQRNQEASIRKSQSDFDAARVELGRAREAVFQARKSLREDGKELVLILQRARHDPTTLLRFINSLGDDEATELTRLRDIQAELQRIEIQAREPIVEGNQGGAGPGDGTEPQGGYASADWLEHNHGIIASRLSEAKSAGKVKSKPATEKQPDSDGRTVRTLYNVQDAIKHCSPKHVKKKTGPLRPSKS